MLKIILITVALFLVSCDESTHSQSTRSSSSSKSKQWYSGGTLHKSTLGEWNAASYKNRLATCADFAVIAMKNKNKKITSMDSLRTPAIDLEICISTVAVEPALSNQKVSDIAAGCIVLMDN